MKPHTQRMPLGSQCLATHRYQRGSIMPMTIIALVAMMGIAGLVTDFAPLYWDKNKLQNAADAAALAAEESMRLNPNDSANAITQAKLVFAKQKPTGAADLQDENISIQTVDSKPVVTITGVSVSRDSALTRVLPGAKNKYGVSAQSVAKLNVTTSTSQACVSPMVICEDDVKYVAGGVYSFEVGDTAGILCKDDDKTCNPSSSDDDIAEGTYTLAGGDVESYCYDPTKTVKKGVGNGNVKKGVNARFFDDKNIPSGFGTVSNVGVRDRYAYPFSASGKAMRDSGKYKYEDDPSYGNLSYAGYKAAMDADTNRDVFGVASADASAKYRRVLYVAQLPKGSCTKAKEVTFTKDQVKVWCMFIRKPMDSDKEIVGELFQDCGNLATVGHTVEVQSTRLGK